MGRKITAGALLTLMIVSMFVIVFIPHPVRAFETIYIRANGIVDPPSAPISQDGNVYSFDDSINGSVVVEKSNIVISGAGYALRGSGDGNGIDLSGRSNVTIEDITIRGCDFGVYFYNSLSNHIYGSNLSDNDVGLGLWNSSGNILNDNFLVNNYNSSILLRSSFENTVTQNLIRNNYFGISVQSASAYNNIFRNTITVNDQFGIYIRSSSNNNVTRNNIRDNYGGIGLESCSDNFVYNNNFINNSVHVSLLESMDFWNASYPICGNFWINYNGTDYFYGADQNQNGSDGIGDTGHIIYAENVDHYPLMDPWILDLGAQNQMIVAYPSYPQTLDPAVAYDTMSAEPIMNVYETLIFFDEEKTDQFVPRLATNWYISPDGLTYTFTIRQGVKFHNNETLTTEDVEYSFERLMVIDYETGPAWMLYEPLLDVFGSRDAGGNLNVTGRQIDDAVTRNATAVIFHLAKPYPPFMQILAEAWSSTLCKKWCAEIGDWPGTWSNWTLYNRPSLTAIDSQNTEPPGPHINAMCGTGPYMLDYFRRNVKWSLIKFDQYWGGWPASGSAGFLQRVTSKRIVEWGVRKYMFLEGQLDYLPVPTAAIDEVLGQPGVRCIYPLEDLVCTAMFFTFNISTSSPYLGVPTGLPTGTFNESGIPPDFFSDINVRRVSRMHSTTAS